MKTKHILLILLFLNLELFAQKSKIKVSITNQSEQNAQITVKYSDNFNTSGKNLWIPKVIAPNERIDSVFKIDRFGYLSIEGFLINDKKIKIKLNRSTPFFVKKSNENYVEVIQQPDDLKEEKQVKIDDIVKTDIFSNIHKEKYLNSDFDPKPVSTLISEHLGGLVLYYKDNSKIIVVHKISPRTLGLEMDFTSFPGTGTTSESLQYTSATAQNISITIPTLLKTGFNLQNNTLYRLNTTIENVGIIDYATPKNKNVADAISSLSGADAYSLSKLRKEYLDNGKILSISQINRAFGFEGAYHEVVSHKEVLTNNEADLNSIFTNKGTFNSNYSEKKSKIIGSSYLGYWFEDNNYSALLDRIDIISKKYILESLTLTPDVETAKIIYEMYQKEILGLPQWSSGISKNQIVYEISSEIKEPISPTPEIELIKLQQHYITRKYELENDKKYSWQKAVNSGNSEIKINDDVIKQLTKVLEKEQGRNVMAERTKGRTPDVH